MDIAELVAEAKSHAASSQYDPADDPISEATPDAVALAVAELKARGQDDDAARLLAEFGHKDSPDRHTLPTWAKADPSSFYDTLAGDPVYFEFAEWKSYTNPKTKRSGWISSNGLVRYTKPGGKDDTVEPVAAPRLKADYEVTPERVEKLAKHYHGLGPEALSDFVKSMSKKVGSVQAKLAAAVAVRVKELQAGKPEPKPLEPVAPPTPVEPEPTPEPPIDLKAKDPNHDIPKLLAASPHVKRVFAAVMPAIAAHEKANDTYMAAVSASTSARMATKQYRVDQAAAENAYSDHVNRKPIGDPAAHAETSAALRVKMEVAQDAARKAMQDVIDAHSAKVTAARAANDEAELAVRTALTESAKPITPMRVESGYDAADHYDLRLAGKLHRDFVPIAADGTPAAIKTGEEFITKLVNHASETPYHAAYGVSANNRGFCYWTAPDTGTDKEKPYSVVMGRDVDKGNTSGVKYAEETAVHELGHAVEHRKGLLFKAKKFLEYRCGDEEFTSMRSKFGDSFKESETGRKDNFDKVFTELDAYYVGKDYPHATEVFSMGLEKLYKDPIGFFTGDPEYAAFVLHHTLS